MVITLPFKKNENHLHTPTSTQVIHMLNIMRIRLYYSSLPNISYQKQQIHIYILPYSGTLLRLLSAPYPIVFNEMFLFLPNFFIQYSEIVY